jgi:uncharacterized membrane protein YhaH (DUF805 family)
MTIWYYAEDDERRGPVDEAEIARLIGAHQIVGDTLVWRDGLDGWEAATRHFSFADDGMPPPPPPSADRDARPAGSAGSSYADPAASGQVGPDGLYVGAPSRSFGEAIRVCFSKYATFSGRASRSEYWFYALFLFLAGLAATLIDAVLVPGSLETGGPANAILSLGTLLPTLAVSWRRLHDTDRSGWWIGGYLLATIAVVLAALGLVSSTTLGTSFAVLSLLAIAAIGYSIMLLVFFCQRGTPMPNRFG